MEPAVLGALALLTTSFVVALDSVMPAIPSELLVVSASATNADDPAALAAIVAATALGALIGDVVVLGWPADSGAVARGGRRRVPNGLEPAA